MKDFLGLIFYLLGVAMLIAFPLSLLNAYFDWHLGVYGVEIPADPYIGILFLIIGLLILGGFHLWDKIFPKAKE